ncbi:hypothetical protein MXB_4965 [Myxobolus squamalis]|nr:hypothetical protein MXB_4965 [Myxobolus squamalis]
MKSMVLELVNRIVQVHGGSTVMNKTRFYSEFHPTQDQIDLINARTNLPSDYVSLFGGNSDDYFRLGIGVTQTTIKLYENFYRSEIIIASPLGLRTLLGSEGDPDRDFNFLSSVQIAVLSHTNMFMMQNWDHLIDTLSHVNLLPTSTTYTDFSRIYEHCSEQQSKYYRQTLLFSDFMFPELNCIARRFCNNLSGVATITCNLSSSPPKICSQTILQDIKFQRLGYVLVFVSSYIDYLKLLKTYEKDICCFICEYTNKN